MHPLRRRGFSRNVSDVTLKKKQQQQKKNKKKNNKKQKNKNNNKTKQKAMREPQSYKELQRIRTTSGPPP